MSKPSGNRKSVEVWTVKRGTSAEKTIVKIAVRDPRGRFHGSTNFPDKG